MKLNSQWFFQIGQHSRSASTVQCKTNEIIQSLCVCLYLDKYNVYHVKNIRFSSQPKRLRSCPPICWAVGRLGPTWRRGGWEAELCFSVFASQEADQPRECSPRTLPDLKLTSDKKRMRFSVRAGWEYWREYFWECLQEGVENVGEKEGKQWVTSNSCNASPAHAFRPQADLMWERDR